MAENITTTIQGIGRMNPQQMGDLLEKFKNELQVRSHQQADPVTRELNDRGIQFRDAADLIDEAIGKLDELDKVYPSTK